MIEDAEDASRRLFLHAKNNLAQAPQGLAFRLEQCLVGNGILASRIFWDAEPVAITANEALAAELGGNETRTAKADAMEFLKAVLASGQVPAAEINRMAREHGLTAKAIRSAREALSVKIDRDGFGPGSKSLWSLSEGRIDAQPPHTCPLQRLGTYGPQRASMDRKRPKRIELHTHNTSSPKRTPSKPPPATCQPRGGGGLRLRVAEHIR